MLTPILEHAWAFSPLRLATAAGVTVIFALAARIVRGVNASGAIAGGIACFLLLLGGGPAAFAALVVLFLMTWLSTHLGYGRKRELGLAERREGRNGWQVSANLGVAAISSLLYAVTGNQSWLVAMAAAIAEAATDTVASEIGQTRAQNAILITTGESVPSGTDGGITLIGTTCGAAAGVVIAVVAVAGRMIPQIQLWIPAVAGAAGMFFDSLLGATAQRRGWLSNEAVNLWGTMAAAALAYATSLWLHK
jgi:uncharacterized protein (TIGR00297 family)